MTQISNLTWSLGFEKVIKVWLKGDVRGAQRFEEVRTRSEVGMTMTMHNFLFGMSGTQLMAHGVAARSDKY